MMLSREQAEGAVEHYAAYLEKQKKKVRKNFEEMDLENVKLRDDMEEAVEEIEKEINQAISSLNSIYFES